MLEKKKLEKGLQIEIVQICKKCCKLLGLPNAKLQLYTSMIDDFK